MGYGELRIPLAAVNLLSVVTGYAPAAYKVREVFEGAHGQHLRFGQDLEPVADTVPTAPVCVSLTAL